MSLYWKPSEREKQTAESAALARAAGALEPDSAVRCPDYLAWHFLEHMPELCPRNTEDAKRIKQYRERCIPGIYYYHVARTKHLDALLLNEISRGLQQLVILGAGYDTRPYRMKQALSGVRVFEVDLPDTQANKVRVLTRIGGVQPSQVIFVPVDFSSSAWPNLLIENGFDPSLRTFFIWEGVTYYLSESAVDDVLRFVYTTSRVGSSIAFDYLYREVLDGYLKYYGSSAHVNYVKEIGEPFRFGIYQRQLANFLLRRGFTNISKAAASDLEKDYLIKSDGLLYGKAVGHLAVAHATI